MGPSRAPGAHTRLSTSGDALRKGSGVAARPWVMAERSPQVISLSLNNPEEMFVLASVDLFSEYRNFMTGLEYCISVLRGRPSSRPVRIDLALPTDQISGGLDQRIRRTLGRYCDHRIAYKPARTSSGPTRRSVLAVDRASFGGVGFHSCDRQVEHCGRQRERQPDPRFGRMGIGVGGSVVPSRHALVHAAVVWQRKPSAHTTSDRRCPHRTAPHAEPLTHRESE